MMRNDNPHPGPFPSDGRPPTTRAPRIDPFNLRASNGGLPLLPTPAGDEGRGEEVLSFLSTPLSNSLPTRTSRGERVAHPFAPGSWTGRNVLRSPELRRATPTVRTLTNRRGHVCCSLSHSTGENPRLRQTANRAPEPGRDAFHPRPTIPEKFGTRWNTSLPNAGGGSWVGRGEDIFPIHL